LGMGWGVGGEEGKVLCGSSSMQYAYTYAYYRKAPSPLRPPMPLRVTVPS